MKTVDVVIPVHNSVHWAAWCIEELFRFESVKLRNVLVIDDHSDSEQSEKLVEIIARYSQIKLIVNKSGKNGFGEACNIAASHSTSDIILFLNTDCLVTEGLIDRLAETFETDAKVVLACPVSNNSANLTYPMISGFSYRDMAALFAETAGHTEDEIIVEACTIVGNCLMVRRDFFESAGGFSPEWGIGYGEETDLHMKALSQGLKGVVHTGCYVYHFGGGTFNYKEQIEAHREKNFHLFMSKWEKEYNELLTRCSDLNPVHLIDKRLDKYWKGKNEPINLDVLFYLPGIEQGIGGVVAVIAICNELIKRGMKACIALMGSAPDAQNFKDPVLFNFLYYNSNEEFLNDSKVIPKAAVSTIYWSAPVIAEYAAARNAAAAQFVQGFEGFFDNSSGYVDAVNSYRSTKYIATTSNWLFNMVKRHISSEQNIRQLPLITNTNIFFPSCSSRLIDILLIFRSSPDKGQWILCELLDRLSLSNRAVTVLCASKYSFLKEKYADKVKFVDLSIEQHRMAEIFRQSKVLVDTSLHEGFGLIPFEAALCGCDIVLSDSGGIRDFVKDFDGKIITNVLDAEETINIINNCLNNFDNNKSVPPVVKEQDAGERWYEYFDGIINDASVPKEIGDVNAAEKESNYATLANTAESEISADMRDNNQNSKSRKLYKSVIFPYIPKRLHFALKSLLSKRDS